MDGIDPANRTLAILKKWEKDAKARLRKLRFKGGSKADLEAAQRDLQDARRQIALAMAAEAARGRSGN